jgi:hypothetical protein
MDWLTGRGLRFMMAVDGIRIDLQGTCQLPWRFPCRLVLAEALELAVRPFHAATWAARGFLLLPALPAFLPE